MGKNEFLPFGTAHDADVMSPDDYLNFPMREPGFGTGVAESTQLNTVWRQASVIAATFAQYIADRTGKDVLDDGDMAALLTLTKEALNAVQSITAGNNTHKPGATGDVKLGSAADADIVTSMTDTTAGRATVVGYGGWGIANGTTIFLKSIFDIACSGAYNALGKGNETPTAGVPDDSGNTRYAVLATNIYASLYWVTLISNKEYYVGNVDVSKKTAVWERFYCTGYKPTAADTGALPLTGGKLTGNLEINDNAPIIQLSEADTGKKYFIVADGSGFRIDEDSTAGNSILSYAGASKQMKTAGQFVPGDYGNFDSHYLKLTGGTLTGNLTVQSTIQVGGIGSGVLNIGDNDSGLRSSKDGQVDLWANSKMMGYWNTTTFSFTGQIVPTDYTNFDNRYGGKNTASLGGGGGWWQDSSTGLIIQMGIVNRTGYSTTVTFPKAFPNYCIGVNLTLNMYINSLSDSSSNIRALSHSSTNFVYGSNGDPEKTTFWVAFGK
ncbi:TPA: hypothetical protein ACOEHG_004874 [Enterobacter ludwigii]